MPSCLSLRRASTRAQASESCVSPGSRATVPWYGTEIARRSPSEPEIRWVERIARLLFMGEKTYKTLENDSVVKTACLPAPPPPVVFFCGNGGFIHVVQNHNAPDDFT